MRTVLIVTYYFPPAGGPGVQRVLKFVRYLRDHGWEPVILTVENGAFPSTDPTLEADVPEGLHVYRTRTLDPLRLYARLTGRDAAAAPVGSLGAPTSLVDRLSRWIRANVFVPDARVGWWPFAMLEGSDVVGKGRRGEAEHGPIDVIMTSGPPHSVHMIGLSLQRAAKLPWLADFRDPWVDINYGEELPRTAAVRRIETMLEKRVLRRATAVTTVSPAWAAMLAERADDPSRVHLLPNGFDEEDFVGIEASPSVDLFHLTYVGGLYASRNPDVLWEVLAEMKRSGRIPKLRIRIAGRLDAAIEEELRRMELLDITGIEGYVPHRRAVEAMAEAHLLLLTIEPFPAAAGMITGKLYEYLASGRPVLALGPEGGDADALLAETEGGRLVGRADREAIRREVEAHYDAWVAGTPRSGAEPGRIQPYRRSELTGRLAAILEELAGG